jgi:hypothetical protein
MVKSSSKIKANGKRKSQNMNDSISPVEALWQGLERFKSENEKVLENNIGYEKRVGEIVLTEFRGELASRSKEGKIIPLSEALGLFIAIMWKDNYTTPWGANSPAILGVFYQEIALKLYQGKAVSQVDQAIMKFLTEESQDKSRSNDKSYGKGFSRLISKMEGASSRIHAFRAEGSGNVGIHDLFFRLMEQALSYVKDWHGKQAVKGVVKPESVQLKSERIESFLTEQQSYWQNPHEEYRMFKQRHSVAQFDLTNGMISSLNNRDFNIFQQYCFGEKLTEDIKERYCCYF